MLTDQRIGRLRHRETLAMPLGNLRATGICRPGEGHPCAQPTAQREREPWRLVPSSRRRLWAIARGRTHGLLALVPLHWWVDTGSVPLMENT